MEEQKQPIPVIISEVMMQENKNLELVTLALERTLKKVFGEGQNAERFIDVTRIPLICQNINVMHANIEEIKTLVKETTKEIKTSSEEQDKRIRITENMIIEFKGAMEKAFDFMLEQKKEKDKRESFWGNIRLSWINYLIIAFTAGFVGIFIPLIWTYIKKLLK